MGINYSPNSNASSSQSSGDLKTWSGGSSRNVEFKYKPLDEHLDTKSFRYTFVSIPDRNKANSATAYNKQYNLKDEMSAILFSIEGKPCDSRQGKKLVKKSFELVKEVMKKDYKPDTAIIHLKNSNNSLEVEQEVHIHKCVLVSVDLVIVNEEILLRYNLIGLIEKDHV